MRALRRAHVPMTRAICIYLWRPCVHRMHLYRYPCASTSTSGCANRPHRRLRHRSRGRRPHGCPSRRSRRGAALAADCAGGHAPRESACTLASRSCTRIAMPWWATGPRTLLTMRPKASTTRGSNPVTTKGETAIGRGQMLLHAAKRADGWWPHASQPVHPAHSRDV
jgi:hypothetical protein